MNYINNQKSEIRKIFQVKRLGCGHLEIDEKSRKINQNFIDNFLPKIAPFNNQIFALYQPINNEVNLDLIKSFLITNNIAFCLPKITKKNHHLDFVLMNERVELKANNFYPKILEPNSKNNSLELVIPNVIIVPLIAFDSRLSRIGMGLGFYDRTIDFLKTKQKLIDITKKKMIFVGLAYDFQKFEGVLEISDTDQSLDFIVSEKDILQNL
jgi:5-formyltetrahydrofolate cyclo-ligase